MPDGYTPYGYLGKVDDRLILHLSKKGYQEVCFPRSGKCWSVFSSLMTIKNYMNE